MISEKFIERMKNILGDEYPDFLKELVEGEAIRGIRVNRIKKPDGTLLETYKKENGITLGEMQQVAKNVLNLCLKLDK